MREAAEAAVRRRAWAAGRVPDAYQRRLAFIHAHTVLYALDGIAKMLERLADLPGSPRGVADALAALRAAIPSLRHVRNSAHHVEDRVRWRGRNERPIHPKPVDRPEIKAPGGVLMVNVLLGDRLSYTTEEGDPGEVVIAAATIEAARQAVQRALDAFAWKGPARVVPD